MWWLLMTDGLVPIGPWITATLRTSDVCRVETGQIVPTYWQHYIDLMGSQITDNSIVQQLAQANRKKNITGPMWG